MLSRYHGRSTTECPPGDFNQKLSINGERIKFGREERRQKPSGTRAIYTLVAGFLHLLPLRFCAIKVPQAGTLHSTQAALRMIPLYRYSPNPVDALRM